jgi:di-N-acetylchitobiase
MYVTRSALFLFIPPKPTPFPPPPCTGANASWCQPLKPSDGSSLRPQEIFGFRDGGSLNAATKWQHYDWERVTTVAWADPAIPELTCQAHSAGARVVLAAPNPLPLNETAVEGMDIEAARALWVEGAVALVQASFTDGIVFDWELPVDPHADASITHNYVALINATMQALHATIPGSQVSVCLAWSPFGIDGRWYPNLDLIDAADVAYVMMYDTRSQVRDFLISVD